MALKNYNPTSPARRGLILVDKSSLWKGKPVKALTEGKTQERRRNNKGHVTSRGIAGGTSKSTASSTSSGASGTWRRASSGSNMIPNRTAFIALVKYADGELAYILAPPAARGG
jgi:large subunit ribosomal protein L2